MRQREEKYHKTKNRFGDIPKRFFYILWDHKDSNLGPSACKADALNQLSYDPQIFNKLLQFLHKVFLFSFLLNCVAKVSTFFDIPKGFAFFLTIS